MLFAGTLWVGVLNSDGPAPSNVHPPESAADTTTVPEAPGQILVRTRPSGLPIEVNARAKGHSPVSIATSDVRFPARVAARLDDDTVRHIDLNEPRPEVILDFTEVLARRARVEVAPPARENSMETTDVRRHDDDDSERGVSARPTKQESPRRPDDHAATHAPEPKRRADDTPTHPTFLPMDQHE
jgi:hypothetical protein